MTREVRFQGVIRGDPESTQNRLYSSPRMPFSCAGAVFLMGATSGLVAAPCTVPVLGALLAFVAQSRNLIFGFSLLFVFALGLGLLLLILGTFAGLVASLPKSGPWLVRVKQAFGIFLILAAEFFLIQAGQMM